MAHVSRTEDFLTFLEKKLFYAPVEPSCLKNYCRLAYTTFKKVRYDQMGDGSAKSAILLTATDRPSRHPAAPFGHGNASARRQRSGHSRLAPPRPRMPWRTKVYLAMAPQGGLAPGAAGGCRGWAETQSASNFSAVARQGTELGRLGQLTRRK